MITPTERFINDADLKTIDRQTLCRSGMLTDIFWGYKIAISFLIWKKGKNKYKAFILINSLECPDKQKYKLENVISGFYVIQTIF